jgi:hypothetical protein
MAWAKMRIILQLGFSVTVWPDALKAAQFARAGGQFTENVVVAPL